MVTGGDSAGEREFKIKMKLSERPLITKLESQIARLKNDAYLMENSRKGKAFQQQETIETVLQI
jgi:hypothetical protein